MSDAVPTGGSIFQDISQDRSDPRMRQGTFVGESLLVQQLAARGERQDLVLKTRDGKELTASKMPMGANGEMLHPSELKTLRRDGAVESRRVKFQEADVVLSLHHQEQGSSGSGQDGLRGLAERRKSRHDAALAKWEVERKALYETHEDKVFASSTALRERLADVDASLAPTWAGLEDAADLVTRTHVHVLGQWQHIHDTCAEREGEVKRFGRTLEEVEANKSASLSAALSTLTGELLATCHLLPPAVERMVEREAMDANRVTLKNRRDYAGVIAKLMQDHVHTYYAYKRRWEACETAWRGVPQSSCGRLHGPAHKRSVHRTTRLWCCARSYPHRTGAHAHASATAAA